MYNFRIFILSNNRPVYLNETVKSFISNNFPPTKIIISDNSTHKNKAEIKNTAKKYNVSLINSNSTSLYEHFHEVLGRVKSELLLVFHDDDLINVDFKVINSFLNEFSKDNKIIAMNFNGKYFSNTKKQKDKMWKAQSNKLNLNKFMLIKRYLDNDSGGIAPWCGYIYNLKNHRADIIDSLKKTNKNDLYFDTYFLINIMSHGKVIWNDHSIYLIREHVSSISANTINSYKIFLNYVNKFRSEFPADSIKKYRYRNLLVLLRRRRKNIFLQIHLVIYLLFKSKYLRKRILNKILFI